MNITISGPHNGTQVTLVIVAQEAIDVPEQKIRFASIGDNIITKEIVDICEQRTKFAEIIGMDSPDFMDICNPYHAIARYKSLDVRTEILSAENKTGIISVFNRATA